MCVAGVGVGVGKGDADPKEVTVDSDSTLRVLGLKLGSLGMVASTFSC